MKRVFLLAGEPSGDLLGARLMTALQAADPAGVQCSGIGGPRMIDAGLTSLFPMQELTLFGLFELIRHLPRLRRRLRQTVQTIVQTRPDVVVTIDAPDFSFRVAAAVRRADPSIRLVHYVAPTVWAWRPGRAAKIARLYDHLLALLPFEPPYFQAVGLPCRFVGHSIVESGAASGNADRFRTQHGLTADRRLLTVLPGSRQSELRRLLPIFADTVARLAAGRPDLAVVVPTLPMLAAQIRQATASWPVPVIIVIDDADKYDAFAASTAALAASGTVALELALARLPAVIGYRIHPLTYALYRRLVRVKYANLVNIMQDRMAVPERLQADCTPDQLAMAVGRLLDDPAARAEQVQALGDVAGWLGQGETPPSQRAAQTILNRLA